MNSDEEDKYPDETERSLSPCSWGSWMDEENLPGESSGAIHEDPSTINFEGKKLYNPEDVEMFTDAIGWDEAFAEIGPEAKAQVTRLNLKNNGLCLQSLADILQDISTSWPHVREVIADGNELYFVSGQYSQLLKRLHALMVDRPDFTLSVVGSAIEEKFEEDLARGLASVIPPLNLWEDEEGDPEVWAEIAYLDFNHGELSMEENPYYTNPETTLNFSSNAEVPAEFITHGKLDVKSLLLAHAKDSHRYTCLDVADRALNCDAVSEILSIISKWPKIEKLNIEFNSICSFEPKYDAFLDQLIDVMTTKPNFKVYLCGNAAAMDIKQGIKNRLVNRSIPKKQMEEILSRCITKSTFVGGVCK